ncbi:hypothetical protein BWI96_17430 [Siphonobacter sp. SORGH_AS_0500]|nr:hypothetical protein BWI96_17430 [Siphonobacter sp. SORGH_AS_0500]
MHFFGDCLKISKLSTSGEPLGEEIMLKSVVESEAEELIGLLPRMKSGDNPRTRLVFETISYLKDIYHESASVIQSEAKNLMTFFELVRSGVNLTKLDPFYSITLSSFERSVKVMTGARVHLVTALGCENKKTGFCAETGFKGIIPI